MAPSKQWLKRMRGGPRRLGNQVSIIENADQTMKINSATDRQLLTFCKAI